MARKGKVFNTLKRPKLLRKEIPLVELGVGLAVLAAIAGMTGWVMAQRDAFDPAERDVSLAALEAGSVQDTLYKAPVELWREPGQRTSGPAAQDLGPFPSTLLAGGWRAGRVETFTADNLYEKINGQAEQYLKFGFQRLDVVTIEHPELDASLDVYLYDQGEFANALGLYAEQRGDRPVVSQGEARLTPNALGASGQVGRYLFHAIGTAESPEVAAKGLQIAQALAPLAESVEPPLPYAAFQSLGIGTAQLGYTPVNAFQFDFGKRFWFASPKPGTDQRLFVHVAESDAAAQALFAAFHAEQGEEFTVLEEEPDRALYQHKFLKTYFELCRRDAMVFGVEGVAKKEDIGAVLIDLEGALLPDEGGEEGF